MTIETIEGVGFVMIATIVFFLIVAIAGVLSDDKDDRLIR